MILSGKSKGSDHSVSDALQDQHGVSAHALMAVKQVTRGDPRHHVRLLGYQGFY